MNTPQHPLLQWVGQTLLATVLAASGLGSPAMAQEDPETPRWRTGQVRFPGQSKPTTVTYEVKDGWAIFEGDILLGRVDAAGNLLPPETDEFTTEAIVATPTSQTLWPRAVIPFVRDANVSATEVNNAIAHWEENTPMRFEPYDAGRHTTRVRFTRGTDSGACFSSTGRLGGTEQLIRTTPSGTCGFGTMVHEIGHTVGLHHEQTRSDRDTFVRILWDNIEENRQRQFCKRAGGIVDDEEAAYCPDGLANTGQDLLTYDYGSIMHYRADEFSANGQPTIEPLDPDAVIGQRNGLSAGDIQAANYLYSFTAAQWDTDFCKTNSEVCTTGDFNGDGNADIITFHRGSYGGSKEVWVALSDGVSGFGLSRRWATGFCMQSQETCTTGDFNGDGKDDIITFHHGAWGGSSQVFVYLSDGRDSFDYTGSPWTSGFCVQAPEVCVTGDFNGDGKDDILTFHHGAWGGSNTVFVYLSDGSRFTSPGRPWHPNFCAAGLECAVGDVNGDGKEDIMAFVKGTYSGTASNDVYVALSTSTGFGTTYKWHEDFCRTGQRCLVGDVNGDGQADAMAITPGFATRINVALSTGNGFGTAEVRGRGNCTASSMTCTFADVDNDQHADLVTFKRLSGVDGQVHVDLSNMRHAEE